MTDAVGAAVLDPNLCAHPTQYDELFTRLRREEPVRWTEPPGCRPFWLLSKVADIIEVERQPEIFISHPRTELQTIVEEEAIKRATGGKAQILHTLLHMDGAEHRSYRGLTQIWFAPPNIKKLETTMDELAKEYVDRLEAFGGQCDFAADIAIWYPLRVIMMILGIPREEEQEIMRLTQQLTSRRDPEGGVLSEEGNLNPDGAVIAAQAIFGYFENIYRDRLANPRDDLASVIAHAKVDGEPITHIAAMSYYLLIATAGHDTTAATIAGGLLAMIENPDQMEKARNNPEVMNTLPDELIRWVSPVKHFFRTAAQDYELSGKQIKAGDSLMMAFAGANRDEAVFDDSFAFRLDRTPNKHVALGHGAHLCLGQHLAKLEMRAFFREFLSRVEHIELTGEPIWMPTTLSGGLTNLPVRYRMRRE